MDGEQENKAAYKKLADRFLKNEPLEERPYTISAGLPFTIKDSGTREHFASGMSRDTAADKIDWELIFNGPMARRLAIHLTAGQVKYPDPEPGKANWMRASGMPELVRFRKSAVRHFLQWLNGDVDEDHAAAVLFNINGYEYVKAKLASGIPDTGVAVSEGQDH